MNILITGGAGFIGSHLADSLIEQGHKVYIIDNFVTGRNGNINTKCGHPVVGFSIANPEGLKLAFDLAQPDVVVHAAASYKDPSDWVEDSKTTVEGTALVCQL